MPDTHIDIAKRRAARRKKIRRRRIAIGSILFLTVALIIAVILSLTVLFPIKNVSASGSGIYDSEVLISASGINDESNFFLLSEKDVLEIMREELPYIDSVKLIKAFPDSVTIKVNDAEEYACYNVAGKYYPISKKGYVLSSGTEPRENIFEIICNDVECKPGKKVLFNDEYMESLIQRITDTLLSHNIVINLIDVTNQINLKVRVEGRFDVNLGSDSNLDNKIAHLSSMIATISEERTGKINLSMWSGTKSEGSFVEGPLE